MSNDESIPLTSNERTSPHSRWLREAAKQLHSAKQTALANTCEGAAWEIEALVGRLYPEGKDEIERLTRERDRLIADGFNQVAAIVENRELRALVAEQQRNCSCPYGDCSTCEKAKAALSGDPSPSETTASPQAPIARVTVKADRCYAVELYAPGLPPGEHDLYCEPEAVAPMMRSAEKAKEVRPVMMGHPECEKCGGLGWLRGRELDHPDDDTCADTMTKYACDGEKCRSLNGEADDSAATQEGDA